ncbi:MAG: DUF4147 domain-containing protein [Oscillospiraceae bacterium]|nr:DUF4147 domain-containing protein [Oscillospiraceae bacterium]
MIVKLREDAGTILTQALQAVMPEQAVRRALTQSFTRSSGQLIMIAAGKAAGRMAQAAYELLGNQINSGLIISKYGHLPRAIGPFTCIEAGHPVPDENSFEAARQALALVRPLGEADQVIFLLSGGASSLFEWPLIPAAELQAITKQLLRSAASIVEINCLRKRFSKVKGGRFAAACAPAAVFTVVLSDIIGDPLDMIASGPTTADRSTSAQAAAIAAKYQLKLSAAARACLAAETPKKLERVQTVVTGSVKTLCLAAAAACRQLGYETFILTDHLDCQAREAGRFLADIAQTHAGKGRRLAFIAGGETVVHLTGQGKGGRNQELALAAAAGLPSGCAVFSLGSDGTDGPTDAAGAYVDSDSLAALIRAGFDPYLVLEANNAYPALQAIDSLIMTGPTGTNVNDVAVLLTDQ